MQIDQLHGGRVTGRFGIDSSDQIRVAVVELYNRGHTAPYLADLLVGLRKSAVQASAIGHPGLQAVTASTPFVPLDGCAELDGAKGFERQRRAIPVYRQAIQIAERAGATHIHFLYGDFHIAAIAAAWRRTRPAMRPIVTVHWTTGAGIGGDFWGRLRRFLHLRGLRWLIRHAGARVVVHDESIALAVGHVVGHAHVSVAPYPSEPMTPATQQDVAAMRRSLGLDPTRKLVLCFGGTRFDKGADLAISALSTLPAIYYLLIAGKPLHFSAEALRKLAESLGAEDRVHVLARFITDEEASALFQASDVILLPYRRMFSGQSGPLTQAAALGRPVASAGLPVLENTIRRFGLGICFEAENVDAMATAIEHAALMDIPPERTKAFIDHHSTGSFGSALAACYRRAVTSIGANPVDIGSQDKP